MIKPPKYRVRDILIMDKDVLNDLCSTVMGWVRDFMPVNGTPEDLEQLRPYMVPGFDYSQVDFRMSDLELCGSLAFGTNTLSSDIDFNVAMKSWDAQIPIKRWYYSGINRKQLIDAAQEFYNQTGLKIDIGAVDPDSKKYNVVYSVTENRLYNRGRSELPWWGMAANDVNVWLQEPSYIDLANFVPFTSIIPPAFEQHLFYDGYLMGWRGQVRNFARKSRWATSEESATQDEINLWQEKYQDYFQTYHLETIETNGQSVDQLVMD